MPTGTGASRRRRPPQRAEFQRRVIDRQRPQGLGEAIRKLKDKLVADPPTIATRKASEMALDVLVAEVPELLLGSADLTPSNNTRTKGLKEVDAGAISAAATSITEFARWAWRRP